jgi:hypothetical protein
MKLLSFIANGRENMVWRYRMELLIYNLSFLSTPTCVPFYPAYINWITGHSSEKTDYRFDEVTFLPVITYPNKIICAGMNYSEKRAEFNEVDPDPTLFIRFADSQTGHLCGLRKPSRSNEFDYEGELALIIGRHGSTFEGRCLQIHLPDTAVIWMVR